jgi:hypothetical protein
MLKDPITSYLESERLESTISRAFALALEENTPNRALLAKLVGSSVIADQIADKLIKARGAATLGEKQAGIQNALNQIRDSNFMKDHKEIFFGMQSKLLHGMVSGDDSMKRLIEGTSNALSSADKNRFDPWLTSRIDYVMRQEFSKKLNALVEDPLKQLLIQKSSHVSDLGSKSHGQLTREDIDKWIGYKELDERKSSQNTLKGLLEKTGLIPGAPGYVSPGRFKAMYHLNTVCLAGCLTAVPLALAFHVPIGAAIAANVALGVVGRLTHNWLGRKLDLWRTHVADSLSKTKDIRTGLSLAGLAFKLYQDY